MKKKIMEIDGQKHLFVQNEKGSWEDKGIATEKDLQELEPSDISEQIKIGVEAGIQKFKKETEEKVSAQDKTIVDLTEKVKKIENTPIPSIASKIIHRDEFYKKYNLKYQGEIIRRLVAGRESEFPTLTDETKLRELCKFFLGATHCLARKDFNNAEFVKADSSEGTDNLGGYLVPDEFQWELIKLAREKAMLMQKVSIFQMGSKELSLPAEAGMVDVFLTGEDADATESQSTFGQVKLQAIKLMGLTKPITNELVNDSSIDFASILINQFMYAFGLKIEDFILNGDGQQTPKFIGLLPSITTNVVDMAATKTKFTDINADYLSQMIDLLADDDAANAFFVFNRKLNHNIRTLKDSQGNYIYAKPGIVGQPKTVWDYPIINSSKAPGTTAVSTKFTVLGDFKQYFVGVRKGEMSLDVDPYTGFKNDTVRFRTSMRVAGNVARQTAFSVLKTAAE